ncbi:MAG: peptidylprolyl isomerase [Solobacterium sp.]|nr:peptidylprolyl isomerase [Solobacterium sp.]
MLSTIKKNWFVSLVILVFVVMSVYYIYDTNKGKLKGKQSNGEDVVYSINNEDIVVSAWYDELYKSGGTNTLISLVQKNTAEAAVETTDEMKETAKSNAASVRSSYQQNYGENYESQLARDLAATGFDNLEDYFVMVQKLNKVAADYAKANFEDLKIREINYILIQFEDSNNPSAEPTEDEAARMKAVDDLLAGGGTFADAASQFSEDTSTASSGGRLGIVDKNATSLDSSFLEGALALKEGETSDWIRSDLFGYFKINCTASTPETLEANNTDSDPYVSLISGYDSTLEGKAVWAKIQELGIDFHGDADLEKSVMDAMGVEE